MCMRKIVRELMTVSDESFSSFYILYWELVYEGRSTVVHVRKVCER